MLLTSNGDHYLPKYYSLESENEKAEIAQNINYVLNLYYNVHQITFESLYTFYYFIRLLTFYIIVRIKTIVKN